MSKESFYFSHDYNARNDFKIKKLISKHGYLGYGIFWALIEDLYNNDNSMYLDYDCLAYDLRCDAKVVESIINDYGLFQVYDDHFESLSVSKRIEKRAEKSAKARESINKRWNKAKNTENNENDNNTNVLPSNTNDDTNVLPMNNESNTNDLRSEYDPNTIKERKGKESKEKKKEISSSKIEISDGVSVGFEDFWELYGKKTERKKCENKFNHLPAKTIQKIFETLPRYISATPDIQFRKHPLTWLNGECWNDEFSKTSDPIPQNRPSTIRDVFKPAG